MLKELPYKTKWRKFHPKVFARFEELMRNERLLQGELMAKQGSAR